MSNSKLKACLATFAGIYCTTLLGQHYTSEALISYKNKQVLIAAKDPRPLNQALQAVAQQDGWTVDYEDPVYSKAESRDITDAAWRRSHPQEAGLLIPSGFAFDAVLDNRDKVKDHEVEVLEQIVKQYNQSGNPGTFRVVRLPADRMVVSGRSRMTQGVWRELFDTEVVPASQTQVAMNSLQDVVSQCAARSGKAILLGVFPAALLAQTMVSGYDGPSVPCRNEITRIIAALPSAFSYQLLYDIGSTSYVLSIMPKLKATHP